ncbi:hypothetical protein BGP_0796 [Beggiatoa sp. PS]|nr:hypothetical protein BGP_0796 [Beggiatoa sp. PS]
MSLYKVGLLTSLGLAQWTYVDLKNKKISYTNEKTFKLRNHELIVFDISSKAIPMLFHLGTVEDIFLIYQKEFHLDKKVN